MQPATKKLAAGLALVASLIATSRAQVAITGTQSVNRLTAIQASGYYYPVRFWMRIITRSPVGATTGAGAGWLGREDSPRTSTST
jgi:hypothetical protein